MDGKNVFTNNMEKADIILELNNKNSDCFNFYDYVKNLYSDNKDQAISLLMEINKLLLYEEREIADPFWLTNATDLLTGIVVNMIIKNDDITFDNIYNIVVDSKRLKAIFDDEKISYKMIENIINYSDDIFLSVANLLSTKIKPFIVIESLKHLTEKSTLTYDKLKSLNLSIYIADSNPHMEKIKNIVEIILKDIKDNK